MKRPSRGVFPKKWWKSDSHSQYGSDVVVAPLADGDRQHMKRMITTLQKHLTLILAGAACMVSFLSGSCWAQANETMFDLYENNRKEGVGNYITEDFVLLGNSLLLSQTLANIEEKVLLPKYKEFIQGTLEALEKKQGNKEITAQNIRYVRLVKALLDMTPVAEITDQLLQQDLSSIIQADGVKESVLMGYQMDFSRFKPRGRYTRSEEMSSWFRAMTWSGMAFFPLKSSKATAISNELADRLTSQALELAQIIRGNQALATRYREIDSLLFLLFGSVEDMTWQDYLTAAGKGGQTDIRSLRGRMFTFAGKNKKIARIHDGIVATDQLEKGQTAGEVLSGMRLFPMRSSKDSAAFQKLVYPSVTRYTGNTQEPLPFTAITLGTDVVKGFPRGLELMWLLGSQTAGEQIERGQDSKYKKYSQMWKEARNELAGPANVVINTKLMRDWLLNGTKADADRRLNSMLGYWTWGRYTSLLFTKQSVTGVSKSFQLPSERTAAWLEPATSLYLNILKDIRKLLAAVQQISPESTDPLQRYADLLAQLISIAKAEQAGLQLKEEQINVLNNLDATFYSIIGAKDQPIVVDVHTEVNSQKVLEEGLGYAKRIETSKYSQKLRGALFTHFEFKQPMDARMTDELWRERLVQQAAPAVSPEGKK